MWITGNWDVCIFRKNTEIVYGERLQPSRMCFFFTFFFIHSYSVQKTVFVLFISDSRKALSFLGKKRKASQMTEEMTEDHAGIFIMNNKYYVNDIAFEEIFLIM